MAEQVAQRPAAGLLAPEPPGQGAVRFGRVAVEEHRAHVGDPAEVAGRDQLADPLDGGDVPVVVADGSVEPAARTAAATSAVSRASRPTGFSIQNGFPARGPDADLGVQHGRRADRHDVDVGIGEHISVVGQARA